MGRFIDQPVYDLVGLILTINNYLILNVFYSKKSKIPVYIPAKIEDEKIFFWTTSEKEVSLIK